MTLVPQLAPTVKKLSDGKAVRVFLSDEQQPLEVILAPDFSDSTIGIAEYGESLAVAASTLTTVVSFTVPVGKIFVLSRIEASGENVAKYQVELDTVIKGVRRTWWTKFNTDFTFDRLEVSAGSVIRLRVEHESPSVGDFNGTIIGIEADA